MLLLHSSSKSQSCDLFLTISSKLFIGLLMYYNLWGEMVLHNARDDLNRLRVPQESHNCMSHKLCGISSKSKMTQQFCI